MGTQERDDSKDTKSIERDHVDNFRIQQLDIGDVENAIYRKKWWQIWRPRDPPPPPRSSLDDAPDIPVANASLLSQLTYSWITELMILGYQRTLQVPDLWKMDKTRQSSTLSKKLDESWAKRVSIAAEWNKRLENGDIQPGLASRMKWLLQSLTGGGGDRSAKRAELEQRWREHDGRKHPSLAMALNDTFGLHFWAGGLFKVFGDTAQLMCPLLVKAIINYAKDNSIRERAGEGKLNIGNGLAMAIGLFCLTVSASICQHQFFWRSMSTGVLARAALIASIYKRGVNLTPKARTSLTNAALVNHISTDVSRIDTCSQWLHAAWTAPIQISVCLIILLFQLGPSALAGFSLFILMVPIQERLMTYSHHRRRKANVWTDSRSKLIMEVLGAMRVVKYFTYESPFLKRIYDIRAKELKGIQGIRLTNALNLAMAFSIPVTAATLAFVTYTSTTAHFDVAVIFASFSLFQLLRQPLLFLPRALSAISDARSALTRLENVFHADVRREDETLNIDLSLEDAVRVEGATFEWEETLSDDTVTKKSQKNTKAKNVPTVDQDKKDTTAAPFRVRDVSMVIPRGQLIAIVGPVGSGKSSLLQGLIGEMRILQGKVTFGGKIGYCPQTAWIQNATLRDNVLFGQPFDEDRYWAAIEKASLVPDLQVLPDGDLTEIGEKGINLSGGQKQRVNIARALYYDADIVLLDDPLSAVDAHVGKALFTDAIIGTLKARGKTVILVTHALHFVSQCDFVFALDNGRIAEQGTFDDLMHRNGEVARLMKEFGGDHAKRPDLDDQEDEENVVSTGDDIGEAKARFKQSYYLEKAAGKGRLEGRLMVKEKRTTGAVSWTVYRAYLSAGKGLITVPLIVLAMIIMQGSQVINSYTLVWWEGNTFHRPNSFYQILYAMLGIAQAVFTFLLGVAMDILSDFACRNLHHDAVKNVFYAPMSFFDTTPLGRILSVFGKDIDTIDNQLSLSMRLFAMTMAGVSGSIIIITVLEHYFIIAACLIAIGYCYFAAFYRASAREMKRLDSLLRSLLYSHFSESLTGLPTIRSYGEIPRFLRDNYYYIDLEDRALFLTITNQRWMAIRLDFMGGLMVFIVALFAVTGVSGNNAAQIGLVLTYTTTLTQACGMVTRQYAEVENYMNSVERVVQYSQGDLIPQEAPHEIADTNPGVTWPEHGSIEFNNITMSYRPGLPKVLKGISMSIKGGEKIGVVGRTGAGKSSLMLALFRIVELDSGCITIDGVDISRIGLTDLRSKVSIIPQDPLLFSGTVRSNLDPFNLYDDVRLWDALKRAYLVDGETSYASSKHGSFGDGSLKLADKAKLLASPERLCESGTSTPTSRFTLDTAIDPEGANLSVGERSLLSLARALVKDCRVVVLDEATASVDLETDSKIQYTIQTEFKDRTLLCIAHRLRTILSYDRILVLDSGEVVEFDTPSNLYKNEDGVFRSMCDRSNISMEDIHRSRTHFV